MSKGFGNIVNIIFAITSVSLFILAYYAYDRGEEYMENLQLAGLTTLLLVLRVFMSKQATKRDRDRRNGKFGK